MKCFTWNTVSPAPAGSSPGPVMFHVKRPFRAPAGQDASVYSTDHHPPAAEPTQGTQISYTGALFALLAGIAHAAISPVIEVGGVRPNLVLVIVILVTVVRGFGTGIGWAFVAGLSANLLVREPLGGIPLALLLVVATVAAGERVFGRLAWVYPVAATFVGSLIADLVALGVLRLVDLPLQGGIPFDLLVPAALLNAALAALLLYPARLLAARFELPDQPAW